MPTINCTFRGEDIHQIPWIEETVSISCSGQGSGQSEKKKLHGLHFHQSSEGRKIHTESRRDSTSQCTWALSFRQACEHSPLSFGRHGDTGTHQENTNSTQNPNTEKIRGAKWVSVSVQTLKGAAGGEESRTATKKKVPNFNLEKISHHASSQQNWIEPSTKSLQTAQSSIRKS